MTSYLDGKSSFITVFVVLEDAYRSSVGRMVVGSRHWSAELLVDGGWAAAGGAARGAREAPPRRHHAWGSALLAVALVKWGSHPPRDSKVLLDSTLWRL